MSTAPNVQHSAVTADWGTPRAVVELARSVLGGIDLDPASSGYFNHHVVRAAAIYDEHSDGLANPWRGRLLVNPPGTLAGQRAAFERGSVPRKFWERLIGHYIAGDVDAAVWVGFSLEQLVLLQGSPMHPLQFLTLFPCERLAFLQRGPGNGPPIEGGSPTHGNFITLLPSRRDRDVAAQQVRTFLSLAQQLTGVAGAIVRPT